MQTFAQAFFVLAGYYQFVDYDFDVVIFVAVEFHAEGYLAHLAVDAHIQVTFAANALEQLFVVSFASFDYGCQHVAGFAVVFGKNQFDNLVVGVFHHLFAGDVRIGFAGACVQQTQKIVNLGSGANGRTRIFVRRFLLDGDDRTESRNLIDIRTFHIAHKVARVCRKSLDVTALSFGVNGVEC